MRRGSYGIPTTGWLAAVGVSALCLLPVAHASAVTISVNTTSTAVANDGSCSLAEAIVVANLDIAVGAMAGDCPAGSGADVIALQPGAMYLFADGAYGDINQGPHALPVVTTQITIEGHGATLSRSAMAPQFRILRVGETGALSLANLTIENGRAADQPGFSSAGDGGCIYSDGDLHLTDCTLRSCRAGDSPVGAGNGGRGGAIYFFGGNFSITSTLVEDSAAGDAPLSAGGSGGAIYTGSGSLEILDSVISANHAGNGLSGGFGGGIHIYQGFVDLRRSSVSGNSSGNSFADVGGSGGGISSVEGNVYFDGCGVTGNITGSGSVGGSGGGLYANNSVLEARSSFFSSNRTADGSDGSFGGPAGVGGGLYLDSGTAILKSCSISGNTTGRGGNASDAGETAGSGGSGSALAAQFLSSLSLIGCEVAENTSGNGGNAVDSGVGGNGGSGALDLFAAETSISNTTIRDHQAGSGGSAGANGNGGFGGGGGAIRHQGSALLVRQSAIIRNRAGRGGSGPTARKGASGGGIATIISNLIIANSTLSGNEAGPGGNAALPGGQGADGGDGGGIASSSTLVLDNVTIANNSTGNGGSGLSPGAVGLGGGLFQEGDTTFANAIVANNFPAECEQVGGVVYDGGNNITKDNTCSVSPGVDPYLAPLGDNGGGSVTHALCTGIGTPHASCAGVSPAIDAGLDGTCSGDPVSGVDQRGSARPSGSHCDVGAFEDASAPALHVLRDTAARPGGMACILMEVAAGNGAENLSHHLVYDTDYLRVLGATINPDIGPLSGYSKDVTHMGLADGSEVFTVSGGNVAIPSGVAYLSSIGVSAMAPEGAYTLEPTSSTSLHVTTCTGDCSGDGKVSLSDAQTCVNLFLGQPACAFSPRTACSVADADSSGEVSIGEVQQCVNYFITGCN